MDAGKAKQTLLAVGSILAIAVSVSLIVSSSRKPNFNVELHEGLGQVIAEETARLLNKTGEVVLITVNSSEFPVLKTQLEAFRRAIKKSGSVTLADTVFIKSDHQGKYGPGRGLSGARFLRIVEEHPKVQAFVSLVGVPHLTDEEISKLAKPRVRFVAETKLDEKLKKLFENHVLQVAIVPRFQFPAPGRKNPHTPREWFDRYFQVVQANQTLPEQ